MGYTPHQLPIKDTTVFVKREDHITRANARENKMIPFKCNNCGTIFGVKEVAFKNEYGYLSNYAECPTCNDNVCLLTSEYYTRFQKLKKFIWGWPQFLVIIFAVYIIGAIVLIGLHCK